MRSFVLLAFTLSLLAGCSSGPRLNTDYTSANQDSRVQFIVLHYTSTDLPHSLGILTHGGVSAHYLIGDDEPATVYRLVDENRRAWHAGVSEWQGRTWLNATSIGIEIVNQGYRDTPQGRVWYPFSEAQIQALIPLLKDIAKRHGITPDRIIGHSDIAPGRKVDPGPLFPWKRLADAGLVPWPKPGELARRLAELNGQLPDVRWFQQQLARHGYLVPQTGEPGEGHPRRHRRFPDEIPSGPLRWRAGPGNRRPAAGGADFLRPVEKPAGSGPGHTGSSM